jgi:hypothetical protein
MESGFSEGLAADRWVRGGPGDVAAYDLIVTIPATSTTTQVPA